MNRRSILSISAMTVLGLAVLPSSASLLALFVSTTAGAQTSPCISSVPYGNNAAAGHFATVNGIQLYYETYGSGPVLLLMHGNGGAIARMGCQIAFFSSSHRLSLLTAVGGERVRTGTPLLRLSSTRMTSVRCSNKSISTRPMFSVKAMVALSRW
jgi:hypothetical protein